MAQTDLSTTITITTKYQLANFDNKHSKQYANFKETIEENVAEQESKFVAKLEKQLQTFSLQINKDSTKFSSKLDSQDNKISSFTTSYDKRLDKMRSSNKVRTNIETVKTEREAKMNMRLDEFTSETVSSFDMKCYLSLQTNLLLPMINPLMISSNDHFSSHLENLHMHHNSPNN